MALRTVKTARRIVSVALLAHLASGTFGNAQQTTGQLLISSGFNPIAATTPTMMARLMSFPADQFVLLQKGGRPLLCLRRPRGMHLRLCRQRGCDGQIPSQLSDIAG